MASGCDAPGDGFDALVNWLARRNDLRFIIPRDAFEEAPPQGAFPYVGSRGRMGLLSVGRRWRRRDDPRRARLHAQGAAAEFVDVAVGPQGFAAALDTLRAAAAGRRHG